MEFNEWNPKNNREQTTYQTYQESYMGWHDKCEQHKRAIITLYLDHPQPHKIQWLNNPDYRHNIISILVIKLPPSIAL